MVVTRRIKLCPFLLVFCIFSVLISVQIFVNGNGGLDLRTYIVHVQSPKDLRFNHREELRKWYLSFLPELESPQTRMDRMVYSYGNNVQGFAARLTEEEMRSMEKMEGFLSAYPDQLIPLHTTHTPEFLGLLPERREIWRSTTVGDGGKGTIIGVIDSGLVPDHPSFRDDHMPSPPAKWKGKCDLPKNLCNNKLIGFRTFLDGARAEGIMEGEGGGDTEFDDVGHGTHTSSTAAGAEVVNANLLGQANGTAVGMAPRAHLAMYRACAMYGCQLSDVLAGISSAIDDGVDVISISLGGGSIAYYRDTIAIGTFRAMQKGISVSCSAGNDGPASQSLSNEAPWVLTVAAGTTDRRIRSTVRIGNGKEFYGETLYQPKDFKSISMPLIRPDTPVGAFCSNGAFDNIDIKGKIVVCDEGGPISRVEQSDAVKAAGGAAMILVNDKIEGYSTFSVNFSIPASHISYADGVKIKAYMNSNQNPMAAIVFKGTVLNVSPSPTVTFFSSRGPSMTTPGILKPDVIGPGVNILAAWPSVNDHRPEARLSNYSFHMISGTSMAAPHLGGISALIKSSHPDWSPAAIKSAIMTTSDIVDRHKRPIKDERNLPARLFTIGSGHVNPVKANNPGLIYDIDPNDYISFLCEKMTDVEVRTIVGEEISCSKVKKLLVKDLNYPSISVNMEEENTVTVTRTVTNVGPPGSVYEVTVVEPEGVSVTVEPEMLSFSGVNEKIRFTLTLVKKNGNELTYSDGQLTWFSGEITVRSPISVAFV